MKVTEMLSLLSAFDEVYASSYLTHKEKAVIGTEVLLRLPHVGLFEASDDTLKAVVRSIGDRVAQLEETDGRPRDTGNTHGTPQEKPAKEAPKGSPTNPKGSRVLRGASKDA
jgi:hypothetical protein